MGTPGWKRSAAGRWMVVTVTSLVVLGLAWSTARADEPGFFGRLFRGGQGSDSRRPAPGDRNGPPVVTPGHGASPNLLPPPTSGAPMTPAPSIPAYGAGGAASRGSGAVVPPPSSNPFYPPGPATSAGTDASSNTAAPVIRPQPRNARAATVADPLLSRVMLGRTNDGSRFGMFLQIYADGTVIDSEGVHRLPPDALRGVVEALQAPELGRADGHCGGPPTDFIEEVYVVVYRRKLGGLTANSFSYSGNTAGCDASIRALHTAVEALQARLASPGGEAAGATSAAAPAGPAAPTFSPEVPETASATLSLTPGM